MSVPVAMGLAVLYVFVTARYSDFSKKTDPKVEHSPLIVTFASIVFVFITLGIGAIAHAFMN